TSCATAGGTGRRRSSSRAACGGSRSCRGASGLLYTHGACPPGRGGGSTRSGGCSMPWGCRSRCSVRAWGRACPASWWPLPWRCCCPGGLLADRALRRRWRGDEQNHGGVAGRVRDRQLGARRDQRRLPLLEALAAQVHLHDDPAGHDEHECIRVGVLDRTDRLVPLETDDLGPQVLGIEQLLVMR